MSGEREEAVVETIGIIGAGDMGSEIARAAISRGYKIVLANSRGQETLSGLVNDLGPSSARAARAAEAAAAGDFVILSFPLKVAYDLPVDELAGKIVLDTNNYMIWRDDHIPVIDSGEKTVHELRQEQLPTSKVAKAFTHIQHERLRSAGRPAGHPERVALAASSDHPEAVDLVTRLYDQLGYDTADHSPLSESWRTAPGQPAWVRSGWQSREELLLNLKRANPVIRG
jgi:predicted dinucleotide-binding enzyme